jgi:ABC-2 type transport system ATP-binding protein/lipopolysaccharide transport system ATP-binding protein
MRDMAISVEDVSKKFTLHTEKRNSVKERLVRGRGKSDGEFWALRNVSFDVPRGTTFGLVGHNGSGKSTMLKLLAGVHRPTSGSVVADGRVSALLELGAGFHGELTGRENIYLNASILGLSKKQIDASVERIIDFSGIGDFIDTPVKVYSSGMYVRLGFSIAVTVDPEILIVDEIIAVGDEEFQRKCFDYLFELRRKGTTIVLVSHSLGLVQDLCDGAAWLDHGRVKAVGTSRDVVQEYVDAVNDREAAQRGQQNGAEPETLEGHARIGSGEVRVERVEYFDRTGQPASVVVAGEPATFRLHYSARSPMEEVVFGLGFVHESGVTVSGPNSGSDGSRVPRIRNAGHIDFHVPRLALQPGTYQVSAAAVSKGHTYDYVDRAYELHVRGTTTEPGLSRMFGEWTYDGYPVGEPRLTEATNA